ncbi:MAG: hypothetical protein LPJ91_05350 [Pseudazoarcus pumilus]|nr:hypothetical protein [Pseudazoarcus pumilus]
MNPAAGALCYDATPPLHVPVRFMLTAPLFGVAAGLLLLAAPEALSSRWEPAAFALTHLLAVGFMLLVMCGALFQILPVVCGVAIAGGTVLATAVHVALSVGAGLLAGGLGSGQPALIQAGGALLGLAAALFVLAVAIGLWGRGVALDTQRDLRVALLGLGVAVLLGATLAMVLSGRLALPFGVLLELHVGWALLGGAGMLLAATSWIVIPMFQITPAYPGWMTRGWALAVFVLLVLWSAVMGLGQARVANVLLLLPLALAALFAVTTLLLQQRSRRSAGDATTRAFRMAMLTFLAGLACAAVARMLPDGRWAVMAGVLLLYGGFSGVIQGMLYKIVPFLCWLNLSQAGLRAPNVKKLQPDRPVMLQARIHLLALAAVALAVVSAQVWLTRLAGVLVVIDFAGLLWVMGGVVLRWRRAAAQASPRPRDMAGSAH